MFTVAELIESLEDRIDSGEIQENDIVLLKVTKPSPDMITRSPGYTALMHYATDVEQEMNMLTDRDTGIPSLKRCLVLHGLHALTDQDWEDLFASDV